MTARDDGGQAFPRGGVHAPVHEYLDRGEHGMTLRDWFAGQALSGNLAAEDMGEAAIERLRTRENALLMARRAYQMADAMIEARK